MKKKITPWMYNEELYIPDARTFGFIYIVTFENGEYYIGKKQLKVRRGKKKAKTSKRMMINWVEDWNKYQTSSKIVKERLKQGEIATFSILKECYIKGELTYNEIYYQFKYDVLADPLSLNDNISGKYFTERVTKYTENKIG